MMAEKENPFSDSLSMRTIDRKRIIYLFIAIGAFFITETGRELYRPFIYSNNINDFGLADCIGNLGGIIVQIYVMLAFFNPPARKGVRVIIFLVLGYIIYEIAQPYLPKGVFDWLDIYGTIIGGAIATIAYLSMGKLLKNNKVIYIIGNKREENS